MAKDSVYLLWRMPHDREGVLFQGLEYGNGCLIGAYSSKKKAEDARDRAKILPGFSQYSDGFVIDEYAIDEDHWTSGVSFDVPAEP
jgi:hypothetical protein